MRAFKTVQKKIGNRKRCVGLVADEWEEAVK
jgi:hypothetical protein